MITDAKSFGEALRKRRKELGYTQVGDYLLPDLLLPGNEEQTVGLWGRRHARWLRHNRRITYTNLLTSGKLPGVHPKPAAMTVETISLMRSDRGRNGMIYTELGTLEAEH